MESNFFYRKMSCYQYLRGYNNSCSFTSSDVPWVLAPGARNETTKLKLSEIIEPKDHNIVYSGFIISLIQQIHGNI